MPKRIYKYPLLVQDEQELYLPDGAQYLTVQVQGDKPCLWCIVEADIAEGGAEGFKKYKVWTRGTGHDMVEEPCFYVGTYQLLIGRAVFHVFTNINTINRWMN